MTKRVKSLIQPATYLRALQTRRLIEKVDHGQLETIKKRYWPHSAPIPTQGPEKYLDVLTHLKKNLRRVQYLGLHSKSRRGRAQRILDLGCGPGYFMCICQDLGHECIGLDVGDIPMYEDFLSLFHLRSIKFRIEPYVSLPPLGMVFDWVTAYATTFNRSEGAWWGHGEWDFFLSDVRKHLAPGGHLFLSLNPRTEMPKGEERWKSSYTPGMTDLFRTHHAVIDHSKVLLSAEEW